MRLLPRSHLQLLLDLQFKPETGDAASLFEETRSTCSDTPDLSDGSDTPTTSVQGWISQPHSPVSWSAGLPEFEPPGPYGHKDALEHLPQVSGFELVNERLEEMIAR